MVEWTDVMERFSVGDSLQPLIGSSRLTVDSIDENEICIRQRLWRACVTRAELAVGDGILTSAPAGTTPVQLSELIRDRYASGTDVVTDCTRIPNLVAVVLYNMGVVPNAAPS
ncbi:hypothetical protein ACFQ34_32495 [Pseudonocardia benzenivorans]|uniref:Uncharacterized protein n=2 Tax=Pseudonocardia TaxID=1847 RepID=F4CLH7_PSEUX|nr:hypothetical protein [Pseudonocardia dioxanivorans]AEA27030.1 hypothetical protein Psed_4887 [Pseudonocardia dioxanivorans CB1190]GJF07938.1 hypothetical protein PSD17_68830 [Pseudonocardia sp. D17]